MSHPTCLVPPVAGPRAGELIELLAEQLATAHRGSGEGRSLVRARAGTEGIELALRPLPAGVHPADVLIGQVVPRRWSVVGVVATATAHHLDDQSITPAAVVVLVDRDGRIAHRVEASDGAELVPANGAPPSGRLVDLLLRSLGRPTAAPDVSPRQFWAALWLDAVVAEVAPGPDRPRTADEVWALHPVIGGGLTAELIDALGERPDLSHGPGWRALRELAATTTPARTPTEAALRDALNPIIPPDLAAWMDDGTFARWLIGAFPPLDDLLAITDALLAPEVARAVRASIQPVVAPGAHNGGR